MPRSRPTDPGLARPLAFVPRLKPRVWGGDALRGRVADPPDGPVGESWEIVDLDGDVSATPEGPTLRDLLRADAAALLGPARDPRCGDRLPLLLKLLDARRDLSVQVHPDEAWLRSRGLPGPPKSEAWYVLHAEPGARILRGLAPGARLHDLGRALRCGAPAEVLRLLQAQPVAAGDLVLLPAGTIHALGAGIRVVEIQRASDVTFRLFDWGRARELHLDDGLSAARERPSRGPRACGFAVRPLHGPARLSTARSGFHIVTVLAGRARIVTRDGALERGPLDSALVPWAAGSYRVEATGNAVRALVFRRVVDD